MKVEITTLTSTSTMYLTRGNSTVDSCSSHEGRDLCQYLEDGKGTCAGITVQANTNFAKFLDDHIEVPDQR